MIFWSRPLIVMDFETSGMDPYVHDILEFGALKVNQVDLSVIDQFEVKTPLVHHDTVQPRALACNGYTAEAWKFAIPMHDALARFRHFAYDGVFCAWNITFEYRFLCEAFQREDMQNIFLEKNYSHHVDIPSIAWAKFPHVESISYDAITSRLGIAPEPRPHQALNGAKHNLELLKALVKL